MEQGGEITRLLQERLVELGYSINDIDGVFGSETLNALYKFKVSKGLIKDTIVDYNTWKNVF